MPTLVQTMDSSKIINITLILTAESTGLGDYTSFFGSRVISYLVYVLWDGIDTEVNGFSSSSHYGITAVLSFANTTNYKRELSPIP